MSIESATAGSVNTIFAQLTVEVGPEAVAEVAHRMGIRSRLAPVCSIGLGTSEITPLEMTSAYATLAARGSYVEPTAIDRVTGSDGEVLQGPLRGLASVGSEVLAPQDADATTRVLQGVIDHGTGTAARLGDRPAAGKTGTAQDATDAWFCGYVPQLVTCVWVGYPDGARPMRDVAGVPEVYGGTIPATIWHGFMTEATEGMPVMGFPVVSYDVYADPPPPEPSPVAVPAVPSAAPSAPPSASASAEPSPSPSPDPSPSAQPSPSPSAEPSPSQEPPVPLGTRSRDP
jgi:penicillin-binding protein 1A